MEDGTCDTGSMAGVLGDGERIAVAADAGGTRQGVALQRIAANLLDNYSRYALGLHARISRRKAGHRGASQASLQELGRCLLSPDFVMFALAFRDMMERHRVNLHGSQRFLFGRSNSNVGKTCRMINDFSGGSHKPPNCEWALIPSVGPSRGWMGLSMFCCRSI